MYLFLIVENIVNVVCVFFRWVGLYVIFMFIFVFLFDVEVVVMFFLMWKFVLFILNEK